MPAQRRFLGFIHSLGPTTLKGDLSDSHKLLGSRRLNFWVLFDFFLKVISENTNFSKALMSGEKNQKEQIAKCPIGEKG